MTPLHEYDKGLIYTFVVKGEDIQVFVDTAPQKTPDECSTFVAMLQPTRLYSVARPEDGLVIPKDQLQKLANHLAKMGITPEGDPDVKDQQA